MCVNWKYVLKLLQNLQIFCVFYSSHGNFTDQVPSLSTKFYSLVITFVEIDLTSKWWYVLFNHVSYCVSNNMTFENILQLFFRIKWQKKFMTFDALCFLFQVQKILKHLFDMELFSCCFILLLYLPFQQQI